MGRFYYQSFSCHVNGRIGNSHVRRREVQAGYLGLLTAGNLSWGKFKVRFALMIDPPSNGYSPSDASSVLLFVTMEVVGVEH